LPNPEEGLFEYAGAHFGFTHNPIYKSDGDFFDFKAKLYSGVFHANLEGVSFERNDIKGYRFQHLVVVTLEPRGGVFNINP
jgi:hypothetical protein